MGPYFDLICEISKSCCGPSPLPNAFIWNVAGETFIDDPKFLQWGLILTWHRNNIYILRAYDFDFPKYFGPMLKSDYAQKKKSAVTPLNIEKES